MVLDINLNASGDNIVDEPQKLVNGSHIDIAFGWAIALTVAMLALLATCGIALWRTTRFR